MSEATQVSDGEDSREPEQIMIEGFRRSRNQTNWLYRGSSMTTSDQMDIEALQDEVNFFEEALVYIASSFTSLAALIKHRIEQNLPHRKLKETIDFLCIIVSWIVCQMELVQLDVEDRLYYSHQRRTFDQPKLRSINDLNDDNESENYFGFKKNELRLLLLHWRIPNRIREGKYVFGGEEAMLVFLYHIRHDMPFTTMTSIFGGDPRIFTYHVRAIVSHLYNNFYHKISGDSMRQWIPLMNDFRHAIWDKLQDGLINERSRDGTEVDWEVWVPYEYFRIFGWLDDTDLQTNRPRPARTVLNGNESTDLRDTQQAFYNRYFRGHGLKAQVLLLPNGMIGSIYICSLRHNDNGVQNLSGLNDYLVSLLRPLYRRNGVLVYPAVYGDGIFATLATIMKPYPNPNHEQKVINTRFSSLREDVEHKFCQVFGLYKVLRDHTRHNLFWNAERVRMLFFTCLFVSNCYTCFNESRNRAFNMRAPTIQQYLPLGEQLIQAPRVQAFENRPNYT